MKHVHIKDVVRYQSVFFLIASSLVVTTQAFTAEKDLSDVQAFHDYTSQELAILQAAAATTPANKIYGGTLLTASDSIAKMTVGLEGYTAVEEDPFANIPGFPKNGGGKTPHLTSFFHLLTAGPTVPAPSQPKQYSVSRCTGTILDEDLILTAAHCLADEMVIMFGTDMNVTNVKTVPVTAAMAAPHSMFQDPSGNTWDIGDGAVLRFEGGLPKGYMRTSMAQAAVGIQQGETVSVAGYGISALKVPGAPKKDDSGVLKKAELVAEDLWYVPNMVQLAQAKNQGICSGDSGGPSYATRNGADYLWGVAHAVGGGLPQQDDEEEEGPTAGVPAIPGVTKKPPRTVTPPAVTMPCGEHALYLDVTTPFYKRFISEAAKRLRSLKPTPVPAKPLPLL